MPIASHSVSEKSWSTLEYSKLHSFSLSLCLTSGQSFAWRFQDGIWWGTICEVGFVLQQKEGKILFQSSAPTIKAQEILNRYLASDEDHERILKSFPPDPFLRSAIQYCDGLRVLSQDPWECLAGFILSSTKQIIHIQQIWKKLCERWGETVSMGSNNHINCFPSADRLSQCSEQELRACGMGFRAPYLLAAAKKVVSHELDLDNLKKMKMNDARDKLMELHGVGRKIADCVLLFSLEKAEAFPVDTWILKVLKKIYFAKKRNVTAQRLIEFTESYFGPYAGHAQQYLFHYARMNPDFVTNLKK